MSNFWAWYYGPGGEAAIFTDAGRIPAGWRDRPWVADPHPLDRDADGRKGGSLPGQGYTATPFRIGHYEIVGPGVREIVKGKTARDARLAELERGES